LRAFYPQADGTSFSGTGMVKAGKSQVPGEKNGKDNAGRRSDKDQPFPQKTSRPEHHSNMIL
jgi:hypothetical protein